MRLKLIGEAGLIMNQVTQETEPGNTDASGGGDAASDGFSPSRHQPIKLRAAAIPEQDECADTAPYGKAQDGLVYPRRRQLLSGSAAGAGVFLAMQAKTALGGTGICQSPSAQMSGNLSQHPHDGTICWGGRSPGYWKQPQHFNNWRGLTAPTFKPGVIATDCQSGITGINACDIATRGTLLSTIFSNAPAIGVWEVLAWPTNYPPATGVGTTNCSLTGGPSDVFGDKGQLLRHLACAYLNASASPGGTAWYPITTAQVIAMWDAVSTGGTYSGMNAQGIISYIEGMYDKGVADSLPGCNKL